MQEWALLAGTELETVRPALKPDFCRVYGVEDAGRVVGCWAMVKAAHAEGVWIHPDYRQRASVARHLWAGMRQFAREEGVHGVFTGSLDPGVTQLILGHGGTLLPGEHFILPLGAR